MVTRALVVWLRGGYLCGYLDASYVVTWWLVLCELGGHVVIWWLAMCELDG